MSNAVPKHLLVLADGTEIGSGQVGDNAVRSVSYTQTVADDTDLAPGAACACKLEIELWVQPGHALRITSGTEMTCYRLDAAGGRKKIGVFRAVKPTKASRNTYKVYAYDAVSRLDGIQSTWLRSIQGQFPMSLWAFAQAVAARCGVTIANTALPANGSYQVQAFYADDLTGRQLLAWVAQAAGCFLRANADGALEFAWYADRRDIVIGPGEGAAASTLLADSTGALLQDAEEYYLLAAAAADADGVTPYYDGTLSYEDYTCATIDKVQIRQSSDDVGVVFPADEAGTNALTIEGNLLLTTSTDAALRPVAQALYAQMQAVEYTPCTVRIPAAQAAALGLGAGQIVRVQDARGRVFDTWIMSATWGANGVTLESTGNASRDGSAATNQQIYKNLTGKMLEIRTSVDGLELKASELQGDYTELLITVDGLTSTVAGKIDGEEAQVLIDQSLDGITLSAANGSESSTLTLKYGSTTLASAQITFSGLVEFVTQSDLSTAGQTTINGGNINTGTISSQDGSMRIELNNSKIFVGSGDFQVGNDNAFTEFESGAIRVWRSGKDLAGISANYTSLWNVDLALFYAQTGVSALGYVDDAGGEHPYIISDPGELFSNGKNGYQAVIDCNGYCTGTFESKIIRANTRIYLENTVPNMYDIQMYGVADDNGSLCVDRSIYSLGGVFGQNIQALSVASAAPLSYAAAAGDYGILSMASVSSLTPYLMDVGSAVLDETGECLIVQPAAFAAAADDTAEPVWLVTGECACTVSKQGRGAIVRGEPHARIDWVCLLPPAGYAADYAVPAATIKVEERI